MEESGKYTLIYIVVILIVLIVLYFVWWKRRDGMPCDFDPHTGGAKQWHGKYLGWKCIPASAYDTQIGLRGKAPKGYVGTPRGYVLENK